MWNDVTVCDSAAVRLFRLRDLSSSRVTVPVSPFKVATCKATDSKIYCSDVNVDDRNLKMQFNHFNGLSHRIRYVVNVALKCTDSIIPSLGLPLGLDFITQLIISSY